MFNRMNETNYAQMKQAMPSEQSRNRTDVDNRNTCYNFVKSVEQIKKVEIKNPQRKLNKASKRMFNKYFIIL